MSLFQLDVTKDHCPMTFVKAKIEMEKLKDGDRLDLLVNEGEPLENIPRSAKEQGFNVTEVVHVGGAVYRITIVKEGDGT